MSLSDVNLREREFHNKLHSDWSRTREDKFYKALDNLTQDFFNFLKSETPNKNTLDFGCGKGIYAKSVINFSPKKLTAIDISEKAIKIAKEETLAEKKNIDFRVENCEMTELKSEDYDVIYGFGILHHLNLEKSLSEVKRLLKKNGSIIFAEPMGTNPIINLYRKLTPKSRSPDEHPLMTKDIKNIKNLFENVSVNYYGFFSVIFLPFYKYPKNSKLFLILSRIDKIFLQIPFFKFLAWSVLIKAKKN